MKKVIFLVICAVAIFSWTNCKSIDKSKLGDKEVVTASQQGPVFFMGAGYSVKECVRALNKEGVTKIENANGNPTGGLFSSNRSLTGSEGCQATGTK